MARGKKKSKSRAPRRRISGVGNKSYQELGMMTLGIIAGGVGARMAATSVGANMNPKMVAGGQILAGGFIAKSSKHPFVVGAGYGCIAVGATDLLTRIGVIKGIGEGEDYVSGDGDYLEQPLAGVAGQLGYSGMYGTGMGDMPLPVQPYAIDGLGGGYMTQVLAGEA